METIYMTFKLSFILKSSLLKPNIVWTIKMRHLYFGIDTKPFVYKLLQLPFSRETFLKLSSQALMATCFGDFKKRALGFSCNWMWVVDHQHNYAFFIRNIHNHDANIYTDSDYTKNGGKKLNYRNESSSKWKIFGISNCMFMFRPIHMLIIPNETMKRNEWNEGRTTEEMWNY